MMFISAAEDTCAAELLCIGNIHRIDVTSLGNDNHHIHPITVQFRIW